MKYTLIMTVVLLMAVTASAQLTQMWETAIPDPVEFEEFTGACPDGHGGVIAVGYQYNTDTGNYDGVYARFNAQGEVLWREVYTKYTSYSVKFADIAPTDIFEDLFIIVGSETNSSNNDTYFHMVMIGIDGGLSMAVGWDFAGGGWLTDVEFSNGAMIACGYTETINNERQGIVIRFEDPLQILWWQTYGTYQYNYLEDIEPLGSNYAITGRGSENSATVPWILKINYEGTELWSNYYPAHDDAYPGSVELAYNGDYAIAGYSFATNNSQYFAMRVDPDGNELWYEEYGSPSAGEIGYYIGRTAGGFYLFGDGTGQGTDERDIWIVKIDDDGTMIDNQIIHQAPRQNVNNVIMLDDDDFVAVGVEKQFGGTPGDCWAARYRATQDIEVYIDPVNPPIEVPYTGGSVPYTITGVSHLNSPLQVDVWLQVEHIPSELTVEVRLIENVTQPANSTVSGNLSQMIPIDAPAGEYRMKVMVGNYPWVQMASDWFTFWKLGAFLAADGLGNGVFEQPELWPSTGGFGQNAEAVVSADDSNLPGEYALGAAYPNPFNPTTTVNVSLPEAADLTVAVYNSIGQQVASLVQGQVAAGTHAFTFDASALSSGVYFVRASVPGRLNAMQKVVLMK